MKVNEMNKRNILSVITQLLIWYGLFALVTDIWRIMEQIFYKDVFSSAVDLVVGIILAVSLYINLVFVSEKSTVVRKNLAEYQQKRSK